MELEIFFDLLAGTRHDEEASIYVGWCPALSVRSQGETEEEARLALEDALFLYIKHCYQRSILDDLLNARGFKPEAVPSSRRIDTGNGNKEVISVRPLRGYSEHNIRVPFHLIQQAQAQRDGLSCP